MDKGHEIVLVHLINVDLQFLVGQGQENLPVFLDGPRVEIKMVADAGIAQ